ncbi:unnamed protein product [Coccothraustes coccothraustes]
MSPTVAANHLPSDKKDRGEELALQGRYERTASYNRPSSRDVDTDVSPLNVASCRLAQTTLGAADEKQLDLEEKSARS